MNLNRTRFLRAVEKGQALLDELKNDYPELKLKAVFSRFGPGSGQCDLATDLRQIVMEFPNMLIASEQTKRLRHLLFDLKKAEKDKEKGSATTLRKQCDDLEARLLDPELKLYFRDVMIEYRPGILKYESLHRLQQDPRLPAELNTVGSIRVVVGALESLAESGGC